MKPDYGMEEYSLCRDFECFFVCLEFIIPLKILTQMKTSPLPWRAANFDICSALIAIEQWGFLCLYWKKIFSLQEERDELMLVSNIWWNTQKTSGVLIPLMRSIDWYIMNVYCWLIFSVPAKETYSWLLTYLIYM